MAGVSFAWRRGSAADCRKLSAFRVLCLLAAARCAGAAAVDWQPLRWQQPGMRFWTPGDLEEGVASKHLHAWRPLVQKLVAGDSVSLLTLGSSIVLNSHGSFHSSRQALRALGQHALSTAQLQCSSSEHGACFVDGTLSLLLQYINATWPHVNHSLFNLGQAGSDLGMFAHTSCYDAHLPASADLLFLESHVDARTCAGCTEQQMTGVAAAEAIFHQVVHKLHAGATPPAVLMSYLWVTDPKDDWQSWHVGVARNACDAPGGANFSHRVASSMADVSGEDRLGAAASYYGWSALSMRNAIWAGLRDGAARRMNLSECEYISLYYDDQIHPSPAGARFLGDALVALLQEAVARFGNASAARADPYALPRTSLTPGAWADHHRMCTATKDLNAVTARGWAYVSGEDVVDHARNTTRHVAKPGFMATAAGASVELQVNTRFRHTPVDAAVALTLEFLRSYEHMGNARLECLHLCACEPQLLNGTHDVKASVAAAVTFNVTQSRHCAIQLTVLNETQSGEHKVKLLALTVQTM